MKGRRSLIWKYFFYDERLNPSIASCITCSRPLKFVKGLSKTSNLIQHLKMQHPIQYHEYMKEKSFKVQQLNNVYKFLTVGNNVKSSEEKSENQ